MGKGSKSRPLSVTANEFWNNWDRVFGDKDEKDTDIIHPFNCWDCGGIDESDVLEGQIIDREPHGDQTVDRLTFYYECALCGGEYVEKNENFPQG